MVMGGDSCSKGRGFESQYRILDGHFSHIFVVKICNVRLKKTENKQKRGRGWPILKKTNNSRVALSRKLPMLGMSLESYLRSQSVMLFFSIQQTENKTIADDWIRTADLWHWK